MQDKKRQLHPAARESDAKPGNAAIRSGFMDFAVPATSASLREAVFSVWN